MKSRGIAAPDAPRRAPLRRMRVIGAAAGIVAALLGSPASSRADPVADFYDGRTMRMLIGYGPGGGYDLYGRVVAQFLPRHLPGHPTIVVQNMPGAGSLLAARYMHDVAPKDGTVLGSLAQTLTLDSLTNASVKIDVGSMPYVGRVATNVDTGVALRTSGIRSFADVRAKQYTVGASGGGSTTVLFPTALMTYAGAKFKLARGYSGSNEIWLAVERGEVEIVGAYGLPGIQVSHPDWLEGKEAVFLYQASLKRDRLIPDVPTLPELALTDEGRQVLRAVASTGEIGRSIIATPGVPAERLTALRKAFAAMLADPDFIAECDRRKLPIAGAGGDEVDQLARETLQLPRTVLDEIGRMMR
jgi:tripartite-type tricarboxylate transporter receptor subunit TctC